MNRISLAIATLLTVLTLAIGVAHATTPSIPIPPPEGFDDF
jgi:hypothetical protein